MNDKGYVINENIIQYTYQFADSCRNDNLQPFVLNQLLGEFGLQASITFILTFFVMLLTTNNIFTIRQYNVKSYTKFYFTIYKIVQQNLIWLNMGCYNYYR